MQAWCLLLAIAAARPMPMYAALDNHSRTCLASCPMDAGHPPRATKPHRCTFRPINFQTDWGATIHNAPKRMALRHGEPPRLVVHVVRRAVSPYAHVAPFRPRRAVSPASRRFAARTRDSSPLSACPVLSRLSFVAPFRLRRAVSPRVLATHRRCPRAQSFFVCRAPRMPPRAPRAPSPDTHFHSTF